MGQLVLRDKLLTMYQVEGEMVVFLIVDGGAVISAAAFSDCMPTRGVGTVAAFSSPDGSCKAVDVGQIWLMCCRHSMPV